MRVIVDHLYLDYVKLPAEFSTAERIMSDSKSWPWFKHAIGALDGSHIPIALPKGMTGEEHVPFRNRKAGVS
jgi:hypothetical protein